MGTAMRAIVVAVTLFPGAAVSLLGETDAMAAPSGVVAATTTCASLKIDASTPADVRAVEKSIGILLGCKDVARDPALAFWTDGPQVSQLARLAVVSDCLPSEMDRPRDLVEALRCYPDVQGLDRAKLDAELDADARFDASAKTTLRTAMDRARASADSWVKQANALAAKSPEARAVLFDAPAKAMKEWQAAYASNKDGVDAALALAPKMATDAARGCSTPMRQHLSAYLVKKSAKTPASATTAMTDPIGYPIADVLAQCEQLDGEPLAAQALADGVLGKATKWHRGPRVAAYWAGVDAIDASDGAQRIFTASFRVFRKFPRERAQIVTRAASEREQIVASVKAQKGGARIAFVNESAAPVFVSSPFANSLAPGQKVIYLQESAGTRAFPLSIFADKDKKDPVAFMGTPLNGVNPPPLPAPAPTPERTKTRRFGRH